MKQNRVAALLLSVALLTTALSLSGCWDRREVNDTAFVLTMGVSRTADSGFRVVVEIVQPRRVGKIVDTSGGGGSSGSQSASLIRETTGKTVYSALSRLSVQIGRTLDEGHCNTIILHEQILKDGGLPEILDYLTRWYQIRREKIVLGTNVDPLEIIKSSPELDPTAGINLYKALVTAKSDCLPGFQSTVRDIMTRQNTLGANILIGRLAVRSVPDGSKSIAFDGAYVLDGNLVTGVIPKDESRYANLILNEARGSTLVLELDAASLADSVAKPTPGYHGGDAQGSEQAPPPIAPLAVQITGARTSIGCQLVSGSPVVTVSVKARGQLTELGLPLDIASPVTVERLNVLLSQYLADRVRATIALTQTFPSGDVFFLGEAIHDRYPAIWRQLKDDWGSHYKTLKVAVTANATIYGTGRSLDPSVPHR